MVTTAPQLHSRAKGLPALEGCARHEGVKIERLTIFRQRDPSGGSSNLAITISALSRDKNGGHPAEPSARVDQRSGVGAKPAVVIDFRERLLRG
jgi:hypothetical protein